MASQSNNIDNVYERLLGKKLALIEELRAELGTEGIECPGVLVVGAQSAGKSSVLERLTNIAFPRAENTCTRVPTIVQLQTDVTANAPFARVSRHANFKKAVSCTTMKAIQDAIIDISDEITDDNCPIKDEPIHIQYTRNAGPVMTLIDLPGITHVDVNNEAFDVHGVTAGMVRKYVANKNMVILVVIPANDDFGNSEALRIAQEVDGNGVRTIGVVSKCDLVPDRSDVVLKIRMARTSDVKLALGFIAVRNKGPGEDDIDINAREESLFLSHPLLSQLSKKQRGYASLTKKIVELQSERVEKFIPDAYKTVKIKTKNLEKKLSGLGQAPTSAEDRHRFLTRLLCKTSDIVACLIRAENVPKKSMNISARSHEIAQKFGNEVRATLPNFLGEKYGEKLEKLIAETTGYSLPNFMNDSILRNEVHDVLFSEKFQQATETLITGQQELVFSAYTDVIRGMHWQTQFPKLVENICQVIANQLEAATTRAKQITEAIVAAEKAQIFTLNPLYMESIYKAKKRVAGIVQGENDNDNDNGNDELEDLQSGGLKISGKFLPHLAEKVGTKSAAEMSSGLQLSIHCYVDVVLKRLLDMIPMVVRNILVFETHIDFHQEVQAAFSTQEALSKLLSEPSHVTETRESLSRRIATMAAAMKKLQAAE